MTTEMTNNLNRQLPHNWFAYLPDDPSKRKAFERWLEIDLGEQFKNSLSANWRLIVDKPSKTAEENEGVWNQFDLFLLRNAEALGPRLLCCDVVRQRVVYWLELMQNPQGPANFKRFFNAMQRHFNVGRGNAKGSMKNDEYASRKHILAELKALQSRVRQNVSHRVLGWVVLEQELIGHSEAYPRIVQNRLSLEQFCNANPDLTKSFASGQSSAPEFVKQWGAWPKRRDPEAYRQALSKLGKHKRF